MDNLNSGAAAFLPHGHCFFWLPSLLWTYVISDSVIAASYFSIPIALWYFVKKRADLPFGWIFVLFGVFVMACGTTHVIAVWNIWKPEYWLDASVKAATALASVATAVLLWPLIPRALAIPTPTELQRVNLSLQQEMAVRRETEAELIMANDVLRERTTALETANKDLESFSYSIAHDLRAPLRHLDAYSNLLLKDAVRLDETERHYLNVIAASATRMGTLVDELLAFSRMSRIDISDHPVDLNGIVDEAREDVLTDCKARNAIEWRIDSLPTVLGDATALRIAFTNLLSNAVKFSHKRAHPIIAIDTRMISENEVCVTVKDNGAGFDPRYASKLFGVFQRLHRDDEFEGNGIGLATVKRIVEKHGGRISAEGHPDRGASFNITLRRA